MKKSCLIITAAGSGTRVGLGFNKLLYRQEGKYLINITLSRFLDCDWIGQIIITVSHQDYDKFQEILPIDARISVVIGDSTRSRSVLAALTKVRYCDYILVHDGARPNITGVILDDIKNNLNTGQNCFAVAVKTTDTVLTHKDGKISGVLDRNTLINMQTPQIFSYDLLTQVMTYIKSHKNLTDEASMLFNMGYQVNIIDGDYSNLKITTREDLDKIV